MTARIFIVEDEALIAMELKDRLERGGYAVVGTAAHGEDAVARIPAASPDLVLMDVRLAGAMSGIEAVELLRPLIDVPVVFLTAYTDSDTMAQAKKAEPFGFLVKPFDIRELTATIDLALYKHNVEKRLRASEERYRTLAETAQDHIFIVGKDGVLQYVNSIAARHIGLDPEEVKGKRLDEVFSAELSSRMWRNISDVLRTNTSAHIDEVLSFPIGDIWFNTMLTPMRDQRGEAVGVMGISRDITERKIAEQKLLLSEQKYRMLVEHIDEVIFLLAFDDDPGRTQVEFVSDRCESITGYEPAAFLADPNLWMGLIHPDDLPSVFGTTQQGLKEKNTFTREYRVRRKDGREYRWIEDKIVPRIGKDSRVTGLFGVARDITERKRAEEDREELVSELQSALEVVYHSQKEWTATFDGIGDMISIHDRECTVIKANKAFAAYVGLSPGEVVGRKCYELMHNTGHSIEGCPFLRTMESGQSQVEEILDPKSGRNLRVATYPFPGSDGVSFGIIHIARDITEEKEQELQLIINERLAALGSLSSGIAHEINNPLASIAGCAESMLNRVRSRRLDIDLFERYCNIILEESARCKKITTSMLSFVRPATYEATQVDLNEVIERTLEIIGFQGRLRDVSLERRYHQDQPRVRASEGELRQVFLAVITNSLDAMDCHGTLRVSTTQEGSEAVVTISDSGLGIPPSLRTKIFDPFFTTKSVSGGTGLGLSIARRIIENHHGSLELGANTDKGAVFIIKLPL